MHLYSHERGQGLKMRRNNLGYRPLQQSCLCLSCSFVPVVVSLHPVSSDSQLDAFLEAEEPVASSAGCWSGPFHQRLGEVTSAGLRSNWLSLFCYSTSPFNFHFSSFLASSSFLSFLIYYSSSILLLTCSSRLT